MRDTRPGGPGLDRRTPGDEICVYVPGQPFAWRTGLSPFSGAASGQSARPPDSWAGSGGGVHFWRQVFESWNAAIHRGAETVCGRITQDLDLRTLFAMYGLSPALPALNLAPRYNGCPTQEFVACRSGREGPTLAKLRWGLVPLWAKDLKMGARMINARCETVHEKPAFRSAFRRRRCAIPVNGWFEWRRDGGEKQPYWIRPENAEAVSLAGLWERWEKGEEPVETFTILTTAASRELADIHDRQPVIIDESEVDAWLDPASPFERLLEMARAAFPGPFDRWRVSRAVNNSRNDAPELVRPAGA